MGNNGSHAQQARWANATPFAYFHAPKAGGTSFLSHVLLPDPRVCRPPHTSAQGVRKTVVSLSLRGERSADVRDEILARMRRIGQYCPGMAGPPAQLAAVHGGLGSSYAATQGRFMGMFREPLQRIASGHAHGLHSWPVSLPPPASVREARVSVS